MGFYPTASRCKEMRFWGIRFQLGIQGAGLNRKTSLSTPLKSRGTTPGKVLWKATGRPPARRIAAADLRGGAEERHAAPLAVPQVDVHARARLLAEIAAGALEGDETAVGAEGGDRILGNAGGGAAGVVAHQGVGAGDAVVKIGV